MHHMRERKIPKGNTDTEIVKGQKRNELKLQNLIVPKDEKAYPQVMSTVQKILWQIFPKSMTKGHLGLLVLLVKMEKGNLFLICNCTYF